MPSEILDIQEYHSKPAPKSHFFTALNSYSQNSSQCFGPVDTDPQNQFRVVTKFTSIGAEAFSCCKGIALVQPQAGNTNKVNLILRPFTQPIQGLSIKYFVYRGLNSSDFFTGSNILAPGTGTSDFINKINADFTSFHTTGTTSPVPPFEAKFIGYDPAVPDSVMLDDVFFKQSFFTVVNGQQVESPATAYELPLIDIGKSLGSFAADECGFEVVLDYGDFRPSASEYTFVFDLAYARALDVKIDITSQGTDYNRKLKREQCCQFLDAVAFYGAHFSEAGAVIVDVNGQKDNKTQNAIYTDILQPFVTKNNAYLYISAERNRSYDFYSNYRIQQGGPESLKFGPDENSLADVAFAAQGWPLLIDQTARSHNESRNKIFLQLVTDNHLDVSLYGQFAQIDNAEKNNFCSTANLKLETGYGATAAAFTKKIILSVPAVADGGQKKNVACFNMLVYRGMSYQYIAGQQTNSQNVTTDIMAGVTPLDDLFASIDARPSFKNADNDPYASNINFKLLKLFNFREKNQPASGLVAAQVVLVNDTINTDDASLPTVERVTMVSEPVDVMNNLTGSVHTIAGDTATSSAAPSNVSVNNTYYLISDYGFDRVLITDNIKPITLIRLKTPDNSLPNKIVLGFTRDEFETLTGLLTPDVKNPGIVFLNGQGGPDYISGENISYQKFRLGVIAEDLDGKLRLLVPADPVVVYSIDRRCYLTETYSKYLIQPNYISDLVLDMRP